MATKAKKKGTKSSKAKKSTKSSKAKKTKRKSVKKKSVVKKKTGSAKKTKAMPSKKKTVKKKVKAKPVKKIAKKSPVKKKKAAKKLTKKSADAAVQTKKTRKPLDAKARDLIKRIKLLIELQGVNQSLDDLKEEIIILTNEAKAEEKKHENKKRQYDKAHEIYMDASKEYDLIKLDVGKGREDIAALEKKKKAIKTIKEFNAINNEIEALSKKRTMKESNLITKQDDLEFKKTKLKTLEDGLKEIQSKIDQKKSELNKLIKQRKNSINKHEKAKTGLEKKLDTIIVEKFNRIYRNKGKLAVVPIIDYVCNGCYMLLPMQVENNVRKMINIIFCPSCSRVLYIDEYI
ncbi:zinc ribbon domain-containing protein [Spirochaetota bacterium]